MANQQKEDRAYYLEEGLTYQGTRYHAGDQLIPFDLVVSLEMMKGKTKAEAIQYAEDQPTSVEQTVETRTETEDGTVEGETETQTVEAEDTGEPLPDDFPHAAYFIREEYTTVESVLALDDYTEVDGISEQRARDVEAYVQENYSDEGDES